MRKKLILAMVLVFIVFIVKKIPIAYAAEVTDRERLGPYTHYNGLLFDYFESESADVEGALAVRGASRIGTSGQFDIGAAAASDYSFVAIGSYDNPNGYPSLLLGGLPTVGNNTKNNIHVHGGPIVLDEKLRDAYVSQTNQISGSTKFAESTIVDEFFESAYKTMTNTVGVLSQAQQNEDASITVSDFTGYRVCEQFLYYLTEFIPNNLNTNSTEISEQDVLVINITDGGHVTIDSPQITSAFGEYELIIFNFPNAASVDFRGGSVHVDGTQLNTSAPAYWLPEENALLAKYSEKIIWNFPKAASIQIYASGVVGSVLAPNAYVDGHGGSINGMLTADTFVMANGHELHAFRMNSGIFDFTNNREETLSGSVILYKVDADHEGLYLEGAVFRLEVRTDGSWVSYSDETDILMTDRYGRIMVGDLPAGQYRFVELIPPEGYELPSEDYIYHEFAINAESGVETAVVLYAKNTKIPESTIDLPIQKVDESTRASLEGAHFVLYRFENEEYILIKDSIITDENGRYTIQGLTKGIYYLLEDTAPDGYEIHENYSIIQIIVNIGINGLQVQYTLLNEYTGILEEGGLLEIPDVQVGEEESHVVLTKVSEDGRALAGARFNLYVYDESNGWSLYKDQEYDLVTDEYGMIVMEGLPDGRYRLVETDPPEGYELVGNGIFEFTIWTGELVHEITAVNRAITGSLSIRKTDNRTGIGLAGAVFTLYRVIDAHGLLQVAELVTDEYGKASIGGLEQGIYWLLETRAPDGYQLPEQTRHIFVIGNDGEDVIYDHEIEVKNKALTGSVTLTKVDGEDYSITLPGVSFFLYKYDESNHLWLRHLGQFATDERGILEITELTLGIYKLVEVSNPNEGYESNRENLIFSITSGGTQHLTITMKNFLRQFPELRIYKVDKEDPSIVLEGAKFVLYRSDTGNFDEEGMYAVYGTAVSDYTGRIHLPNLTEGFYRLVEISPPEGYAAGGILEFEVRLIDGVLVVYAGGSHISAEESLLIENTRARETEAESDKEIDEEEGIQSESGEEQVDTGDSGKIIIIYMLLMAISILTVVLLTARKKRI